MKRRSRDVLLGLLLALVVFLVAAQVTVTLVAERKHAARATQLQTPAVAQEYERPASARADAESAPAGTSEPAGVSDDAVETVQVYAEFWTDFKERLWGSAEKQQDWEKIRAICQKRLRDLSDEDIEKLRAFLTANRDLLSRLKEAAALDGPLCVPQIDSRGYDIGCSPYYDFYRPTGAVLAAAVLVAASENRYDLVWESLLTGIRLAEAAAHVPAFSPHTYWHNSYSMVLGLVEQQLPVGVLPGDVVAQLITRLETAKDRRQFTELLTGTSWESVILLDALRHDDRAVLNSSYLDRDVSLLMRLRDTPLGKPWLDLFWLDREDEAAAELAQRIPPLALRPYWEAMDELREMEARLPRLTPLARRDISVATFLLADGAHFEASLDVARIGLLVEQYHGRHGSYPESLGAVQDGLGGTVPIDPCTGEPFHYRPSDTGFTLYSVGLDLMDDGGTMGESYSYYAGDIVWRQRFEDDDADGAEATD